MKNLIIKYFQSNFSLFLSFCYRVFSHIQFKSNHKQLLIKYLTVDNSFRNEIISKLSIPIFEGLHPKNVFNYRSEFFIENTNENDSVIDIACGTGFILYCISDKIKNGLGIDFSDSNLEICTKKHFKSNLSYKKADIFQFNYSEFSFNTAILSHILEHIEHPVSFLKQINAEKLLICVPSQENWLSQLKQHLSLPYFSDESHFREYTREMLKDELLKANYIIEYLGFNSEGEINCRARKSK